jgi:NADH:ubiquinone oxidoreductase subunit 5 (chain L)/Multisubunit Na+/H+ antiporter, MnhA subunit
LPYFHLLTHAFRKTLLFICAGVVIHSIKDSQVIRFMGNIYFQMPLICLIIYNFALCGMPFLAGFYSKDLILELVALDCVHLLGYFLFYFSTGFTVCYSFRLFYYTLCDDFKIQALCNIDKKNKNKLLGILTLLIMVILGGSLIR